MRPFLIKYNEDKVLNFSKNIIVPKDISFTIKSLSNPKYGSLTKQADNIYIYKPDPNQLTSGKITMTLGLSRKGNPSFQINDVEVYLEFRQNYTLRPKFKNKPVLDKKIYWYPEGTNVTDPVSGFLNDYEGSFGHVVILNNNTTQDSNSEIWYSDNEYQPNRVSELRGKFKVQAKKYRIDLRGRQYFALFISLDERKKYELAANVTNTLNVADFVIDENHTSNFKDYEFKNRQWIYFKAILIQPDVGGNKKPFLGLGLGEIKEDGTVTNIQKLNDAYPEEYQPDPIFIGKPAYPRICIQARVKVNHEKGALLEYFYEL